jgi:hypothetical protein
MSKHSFFGGVLIGLAIDLPPLLVNDNDEFELRTLLIRWGVLAVSGVALYVARPTRFFIRMPNKAVVSSRRVSRQSHGPSKECAAANETDSRSPASHPWK